MHLVDNSEEESLQFIFKNVVLQLHRALESRVLLKTLISLTVKTLQFGENKRVLPSLSRTLRREQTVLNGLLTGDTHATQLSLVIFFVKKTLRNRNFIDK